MNKPIATQRPIATPTAVTKKKIITTPSAAAPKSPSSNPKPKSAPQLRSLPDGSPMYSAIGCINGVLSIKPHSAAVVQESGDRLPLAGIRDQKLLLWLLTNSDQWRDRSLNWIAYPDHRGHFTLVGAGNRMGDRTLEPRQFVIQGSYKPMAEDGKFGLFVGRNNPKEKGFNIFAIDGNLPDAIEQDLWCCECLLTTEGLLLIAGQKMMD
nr:hypothetical protein [Phormidium tenue FACHB-886]